METMRQILLAFNRTTLPSLRQRGNIGLLAIATLLFFFQGITSAKATGFGDDFVYFTGKKGGASYSKTIATKSDANGQSLGTFNKTANGDELYINARANTTATNGDNVQSTQLLYRVYRTDTFNSDDVGSFIPLNLALESGNTSGSAVWSNLTNNTNLLSFANSPGTYNIQFGFSGSVTNNGQPTSTIADDNSNQQYVANFTVTVDGNSTQTSNWATGSNPNTNWFDASNWTNGVPNSNTDVTIPIVSGGSYPTIGAAGGVAQTHNLTLQKRGSLAAQITLASGAQLYIYGNFQDLGNGFKQNGGAVTLAGVNQTFDAAAALTLYDLRITGGGTKTLTQSLAIANSLMFVPNSDGSAAGILQTRLDYTDPSMPTPDGNYFITLLDGANINQETEGAYVLGLVKATRTASQGVSNSFGSIGLDITVNNVNPGQITVLRGSYIYFGAGTSMSIRRSFGVQPSVSTVNNFDLVFHYLNADLNGINANDLLLFRSQNGDIPFQNLFKNALDTNNKILTRTGITGDLSALFTLGDRNNPLPVTLVSFTATPAAAGAAQLKWLTASESNNKGFGVERQLEGSTEWQALGFVAGTNLAAGSSYQYLDKTLASASTTKAYYRLRQEDVDGKLSYSPVAVVSRTAASAGLVLYPVPVSGDKLSVSFAEVGQAGSEVTVTNMQGQRVLRYLTPASTDAALLLPVQQLAAGVYVLSVQVPGQVAQRVRFTKE